MADIVDEYINQFDGVVKERLLQLRDIVHAEAPDAVESISYGLSWQVVPENMDELMKKPDAFKTLMAQHKIIIADYE